MMKYFYTGNGQRVPRDVVCVWFHPSVVKVKDSAFYMRKSLKKLVFNEGLETIGKRAFKYCESLESITLPSTVISIGEEAFYDCNRLRKVNLNEGLKKIDKRAFNECISLERINTSYTDKIEHCVFNMSQIEGGSAK